MAKEVKEGKCLYSDLSAADASNDMGCQLCAPPTQGNTGLGVLL